MNHRKLQQVGKLVRNFFKRAGNESGVHDKVNKQLSHAKVGLNPLGLPWNGQEPAAIVLALKAAGRNLPGDLLCEIFVAASKPKFLQDFGIDLDTAREVERVLDQNPALKSALRGIPSIVKLLDDDPEAPDRLESIAKEILSSPDAPEVLQQCVGTDTNAILTEPDRYKRFIASGNFLRRLAAYGVKTQ
jgi:hypothetical protein